LFDTEEKQQIVISKCEVEIYKKLNLTIKLKVKEFDEPISDELLAFNLEEVGQVIEEEKDSREVFDTLFPEFEEKHCKITHTGTYVSITDNNTTIVRSDSKFRDSYKHISCGFSHGIPKAFVDLWMNCNDRIRCFDYMNIFPNDSLCPDNVFNLWRPFIMENHKPCIEDSEAGKAVNFILNHIRILCDNDEVVYEYLIKWIAQMIQYPEVKTVVISMISNEGAGKGTLMKLFAKMLGKQKILETSTPSRDVFGSFNSLMSSYFLINLNELSKSETKGNEGQFKQMVTDGKLIINSKGIAQFEIDSYHRFFITTNNIDPISTKRDDRRNVIIRSSDEKIGDKDYFNEINKYLDNDDIVKCVYEYFKKIPDMEAFGSLKAPVTDYQNNLKEGHREIEDRWLEEFTFNNRDLEVVEKTPTEVFNEFTIWKTMNEFDYNINSQRFGMRLHIIAKNCITKGKHTMFGDNKIFNITKLKLKYNI
jgi:hypothetical protein